VSGARTLKPARAERTYRGTKFVFVEVDVETYDACVKSATRQVENPITGRDDDVVDENLALRLLMRKSIIQPKITDWNLGTRLIRQLERDVRDLHFGVEPGDTKPGDEPYEDDDSPNPES
jgi:hypothetical protein